MYHEEKIYDIKYDHFIKIQRKVDFGNIYKTQKWE